ncbi:hypothetical protein Anapl_04634 [Anas platyrhynchos]|uniref:Uncharacterized protein n=1 Tax=Anas platyrhynchos TaxID=8839 RepID=R0K347_ANAPL|nr:hypothetical protein Anapl_04634 [Anas platyrhynchos]
MSSKVECGQGAEQHSPVKSPKLRKLLNYVKGSCYQTWFISSSVPKKRSARKHHVSSPDTLGISAVAAANTWQCFQEQQQMIGIDSGFGPGIRSSAL